MSRDEHVAEEITQETFLKALKSIDSFKGNCKKSVWLCQIAKNTHFNYQAKHAKPYALIEVQEDDVYVSSAIKVLMSYSCTKKMHFSYIKSFML